MSKEKFYPEDILIEKMQNGEFGWLDYVNHFSREWKEEYEHYCRTRGIPIGHDTGIPPGQQVIFCSFQIHALHKRLLICSTERIP